MRRPSIGFSQAVAVGGELVLLDELPVWRVGGCATFFVDITLGGVFFLSFCFCPMITGAVSVFGKSSPVRGLSEAFFFFVFYCPFSDFFGTNLYEVTVIPNLEIPRERKQLLFPNIIIIDG